MITLHRWPLGCIFVWERARYLSRDFSRDIFMIWRNYLSHLLPLPTLILDRAVGCRCAHNCPQIEAQLMKANSIAARRNPRNSWMQLSAGWEAPKQSNDSALSSKDILFWMKGQKSGFLWEPVEIQVVRGRAQRTKWKSQVKVKDGSLCRKRQAGSTGGGGVICQGVHSTVAKWPDGINGFGGEQRPY